MLENITVNYETIELMHFYWETAAKRQKMSETYFLEVANRPEMKTIYREDFDEESVRKVLSAVINYEPVNNATEPELEFYQYNKFNADDPGNTEMMLPPVKTLNLDHLKEEFQEQSNYNHLIVNFIPGYNFTSMITDNVLTVNFFKIEANWSDMDNVYMEGLKLADYITEQARKILEP